MHFAFASQHWWSPHFDETQPNIVQLLLLMWAYCLLLRSGTCQLIKLLIYSFKSIHENNWIEILLSSSQPCFFLLLLFTFALLLISCSFFCCFLYTEIECAAFAYCLCISAIQFLLLILILLWLYIVHYYQNPWSWQQEPANAW